MNHPYENPAHRLTVLRKLEALNPSPATNAAPRPAPRPASPVSALRAAGASLTRRMEEARSLLATLRSSKTPTAVARRVEGIARQTANELSAARRGQQPATTMPPGLDAKARREWVKAKSEMTPANARTFTDCFLIGAATHRHSPPHEAAIARAELESRGFVINGRTISKSTK